MRLFHFSVTDPNSTFNCSSSSSQPMPLMLDTHAVTSARADKSRDGYHYFDQPSELTDAAGVEVCIGNSVARIIARLVVQSVCPRETAQQHSSSSSNSY
jgi:hypothetical protein